jgi:hypothetical protein
MKKLIVVALMTISLFGSDLNETTNIFKSLIDDVAYLVGIDKNSTTTKRLKVETNHNTSPKPEEEEKRILKNMGIVIDDGKIEIDANKTKSFFERINRALEQGINSGVKKASKVAPTEDDLGIKVEGEKVEIDLNKTKNFMKKWIKAIEVFSKELNSTIKIIDQ